jgi:hypothetical protein
VSVDRSEYEERVQKEEARQQEQFFLRQRRAINNAYAALQGRATAETFAAFTFEEAADAHIELVEGDDTEAHPNKLKRLAKLKEEIGRAVDELKEVEPERFLDVNLENAVNTAREDSEEALEREIQRVLDEQ